MSLSQEEKNNEEIVRYLIFQIPWTKLLAPEEYIPLFQECLEISGLQASMQILLQKLVLELRVLEVIDQKVLEQILQFSDI